MQGKLGLGKTHLGLQKTEQWDVIPMDVLFLQSPIAPAHEARYICIYGPAQLLSMCGKGMCVQ